MVEIVSEPVDQAEKVNREQYVGKCRSCNCVIKCGSKDQKCFGESSIMGPAAYVDCPNCGFRIFLSRVISKADYIDESMEVSWDLLWNNLQARAARKYCDEFLKASPVKQDPS